MCLLTAEKVQRKKPPTLPIAVRSRSAANHWEGPKKRPQRGLRTEAVLFPLSLEAVGRLRLPSLSDHISPTGAVRSYTLAIFVVGQWQFSLWINGRAKRNRPSLTG